jgi:uracil-DNA glycosylase
MTRSSGVPGRDCSRCPRLVAFRDSWREREPNWFNAPVDSFGPIDARLLVVGLAPGLRGANRTGRPFTGDYAGDLLYATLAEFGFARGNYQASAQASADDGLELVDCRITNAVRCVPPENKPTPQEIATCRDFLQATIAEMSKLRAVVALGRIAHESFVIARGARRSEFPFAHGRTHSMAAITLLDSYHCSRYNTNTGVLTPQMFRDVIAQVRKTLEAQS